MRTFPRILPALLACLLGIPFLPAGAAGPPALTALGPERGWVGAIALSPAFAGDGYAWVAPYGGRIFSSQTHGSSWMPAHAGETDPDVTGLAVSPGFATDSTVFAAADDGVFTSTNAGGTWTNIASGSLQGRSCRTVAVSPTFSVDRTLFAATDAGVYRSTNGGAAWLPPSNLPAPMVSLAIANDPRHTPQILFAGPSSGGLLSSVDGGVTWSTLAGFPASRVALHIAVSPAFGDDGTLLVGTDDGVYVSLNAGSTWNRAGLDGQRIPATEFSPTYALDHTAFAGSASGGGVLSSTGTSFSWTPTSLSDAFVESLAVSPTFSVDHTVLAGLAGSGIELSRDGGQTWSLSASGLHAAEVAQIRVSAGRIGMAGNGGASYLDPGVGAWTNYDLPTMFPTAYDASGADVYIGTQDHGLLMSHDRGSTFQAASIPVSQVSTVGLSPTYASDGVVLAADGSVYVSKDFGQTWTQSLGIVGNDVFRFGFSPAFDSDHTVFAATMGHGLLRSLDGGLTWSEASAGLPPDQINDVIASPAYASDHTAYAATTGAGIYRTVDTGASWSPLASQPPVSVVTALAWDALGNLIAGTAKGIYEQDTDGWSSLTPGWNDVVTQLDREGRALYAGTAGDGVWSLALPQAPPPPATSTPTSTPISTHTPTATPRPTPRPTTRPTSVPRPLHPYAGVLPNPAQVGRLALVWVQGPPSGTAKVSLTAAGGWHRSFSGRLAPDGAGAFGFTAPGSRISLSVTVAHGKQTATVHVGIPVVRPPSP